MGFLEVIHQTTDMYFQYNFIEAGLIYAKYKNVSFYLTTYLYIYGR